MIAPSGEQVELGLGDQRATVVEVGAGLRAYAVGGRDVLDGYGPDELATAGRGQLLAPWPNRIEDGAYEHAGRTYQLPLDEPRRRNAIHGLVRWSAWRVAEREPQRVLLEHVLHPSPGYPFGLALRARYLLTPEGLSVRTTATNVGAASCPFGCGAHPYLSAGGGTVDTAVLRLPARTVLDADERGIPTGSLPVEGTDFDFRRPRPIGANVLDHCFADLERDDDGLARVRIARPDGLEVVLWADASYGYLMIFTGDPLPEIARRSLAVEPMSCPPNAFRTGEALVRLEPGETWTGTWGIAPG